MVMVLAMKIHRDPMTKPKTVIIVFWIVTALFCAELIFTAYWEWFAPQAAESFARLGFPAASFRLELSIAKVLGVLALLVPAVPARLKEWAYAGFAFNLLSAWIAHASIHDLHVAFVPSTITLLLGTCSYVLWRRLERPQASAIRLSSGVRHSPMERTRHLTTESADLSK